MYIILEAKVLTTVYHVQCVFLAFSFGCVDNTNCLSWIVQGVVVNLVIVAGVSVVSHWGSKGAQCMSCGMVRGKEDSGFTGELLRI